MTMKINADSITAYLELMAQRPELFVDDPGCPIITNEKDIRAFSARTGRPMGVVFDNRPFFLVVADLCRGPRGDYSYARVIYPNPSSGGVAVPVMDGKIGLLRIFRHSCRQELLELPRGFHAGPELTPEENIRKELREEMGAEALSPIHLGHIRPDTGLSEGCADAFLAHVLHVDPPLGHEGIKELLWFTREELQQLIAQGKIVDGFTLAALALLSVRYPELY